MNCIHWHSSSFINSSLIIHCSLFLVFACGIWNGVTMYFTTMLERGCNICIHAQCTLHIHMCEFNICSKPIDKFHHCCSLCMKVASPWWMEVWLGGGEIVFIKARLVPLDTVVVKPFLRKRRVYKTISRVDSYCWSQCFNLCKLQQKDEVDS